MSRDDDLVGQEFDGFRILDVAGRGGMGVVYRAVNLGLAKTVAIKMIDPVHASNARFRRRFKEEAQALARTDTSNIVRVHDLRQYADRLFIVMEFVQGETLADRLGKTGGRLDLSMALDIAKQTLVALNHAHGAGVIHRDIKPQNIMLVSGGQVKVTDFGLAKLEKTDPDDTETQSGWVGGTLPYIAPEQVKGKADHRSDIYSVGMVLYQLLTGHKPFLDRGAQYDVLAAIVNDEPPPLRQFRPSVPRAVERIVTKALAKQTADRYQSAAEMMEDIERADSGGDDETLPIITDAPRHEQRKRRSGWLRTVSLVGLTGVVIAGLIWILWPRTPDQGFLLSITTDPDSAFVTIEETTAGLSPVEDWTLDPSLGPGDTVRVSVSKPGHDVVDTSLVLPSEGPFEVRIPLHLSESTPPEDEPDEIEDDPDDSVTPLLATVVLESIPDGTIRVAGRMYSNEVRRSLTANRNHTVRFTRNGVSKDTTFTLLAGSVTPIKCYFQHKIILNSVVAGTTPGLYLPANVHEETAGLLGSTTLVWSAEPGTYVFRIEKFGQEAVAGPWQATVRPAFEPKTYKHTFELREVAG